MSLVQIADTKTPAASPINQEIDAILSQLGCIGGNSLGKLFGVRDFRSCSNRSRPSSIGNFGSIIIVALNSFC